MLSGPQPLDCAIQAKLLIIAILSRRLLIRAETVRQDMGSLYCSDLLAKSTLRSRSEVEVVLLDSSLACTELGAKTLELNSLEHSCHALHRADVGDELETMALAKLQFGLVRTASAPHTAQERGGRREASCVLRPDGKSAYPSAKP